MMRKTLALLALQYQGVRVQYQGVRVLEILP